jgi:hypothetical protein
VPGDQAEWQLKEAANQERESDQQADLGVAQPQIRADQRKRGAFRAVGQLVDELDRERNTEGGCAKIVDTQAAPQAVEKSARGISRRGDRSTSHCVMVTATVRQPHNE